MTPVELPHLDGCVRLLGAVVSAWLKDAQRNPAELARAATWLGMSPAELHTRLHPPIKLARPGERACPQCGQAVVENGRPRRYCSDRCATAASHARRRALRA